MGGLELWRADRFEGLVGKAGNLRYRAFCPEGQHWLREPTKVPISGLYKIKIVAVSKGIEFEEIINASNTYLGEALQCYRHGLVLAGLSMVRAALEALLLARILFEPAYEFTAGELEELGISRRVMSSGSVVLDTYDETDVSLFFMIDELKKHEKLKLDEDVINAMHRIRKQGNLIHPRRIADVQNSTPTLDDLKGRIRDLRVVREAIVSTI